MFIFLSTLLITKCWVFKNRLSDVHIDVNFLHCFGYMLVYWFMVCQPLLGYLIPWLFFYKQLYSFKKLLLFNNNYKMNAANW